MLQKNIFWLMVLLCIGLFVFSIINLKYNLKQPFLAIYNTPKVSTSTNISDEAALDTDQELKNKDTDKDGLTDYDEFNVYNTSPYLADSDSDNIFDKKEIESGNDPNCPQGKNCLEIAESPSAVPTATKKSLLSPLLLQSQTQPGSNTPNILDKKLDVKEIRALLELSGTDKKILDATDDATIMKVYQETVDELGKN